jgi:hypothetical protein
VRQHPVEAEIDPQRPEDEVSYKDERHSPPDERIGEQGAQCAGVDDNQSKQERAYDFGTLKICWH